jgi:hypothetical protein
MNVLRTYLIGRLAVTRLEILTLHLQVWLAEARVVTHEKCVANLVRLERQNAILLGSLRAIAAKAAGGGVKTCVE